MELTGLEGARAGSGARAVPPAAAQGVGESPSAVPVLIGVGRSVVLSGPRGQPTAGGDSEVFAQRSSQIFDAEVGGNAARALAAEGSDLVVVARDRARLDDLAAELGSEHGVTVEVLEADLADPARLAAVEARLAQGDPPVDLAVNNAGFGTYGDLADLDVDTEAREIAVDVTAVVRLTHAALRGMIPRGRGAVMNVSSTAGLQATPGNATYGASKAFVATFGEAVAGELAGTGVTLTTVVPGFTRTEFHERAGIGGRQIPAAAWMSPDDVAAAWADGGHLFEPVDTEWQNFPNTTLTIETPAATPAARAPLETAAAVTTTWRRLGTRTLVPRPMRSVAAAAWATAIHTSPYRAGESGNQTRW